MFTYIYHEFMAHVGKYSIHGSCGIESLLFNRDPYFMVYEIIPI